MARVTNKLTDTAARQASARDKPYKLADGGGLYLEVMSTGAKYWRLKYRHMGKESRLGIGVYPAVSLAAARDKARAAREQLAAGVNPAESNRQAKQDLLISAANTFWAVALEWHKQKQQEGAWGEPHAETIWRRLEVYVLPALGKRPVDGLKTRDLLYPCQLIAKQGKLNTASTVAQYITGIMRHAVQTGRIANNPALDMRGGIPTPKKKHRPALPLDQLPELKRRLDSYGGFTVRHMMLFALLTCARSSEFRFARWPEFDLDRGEWIIPATREAVDGVKHSGRGEKMETARIIPLSTQTVTLLRSLHALTGSKTFVFASEVKRGKPMCENTPNKALQTLGYDTGKEICLHGFRTMACSSLNESGLWNRDAIERHMGHQERDKVRAAYQHKAEYLKERRAMLQWWADYLDAQAGGFVPATEYRQGSSVVYMAGRNRTA